MAATLAIALVGCDALLPPRPPAPKATAAPSAAADVVERPPDELQDGKLLLSSPSLTAGITGNGPLTLAEVEAWLAEPKQHEPFEFVLPIGLRGMAGDLKI